jgi:hypothetical protein
VNTASDPETCSKRQKSIELNILLAKVVIEIIKYMDIFMNISIISQIGN